MIVAKDFTFGPVTDDTLADFVRTTAEGWHVLSTLAQTDIEREHCEANVSEAVARAEQLGAEGYDEENESAFIPPHGAISALRLALRALLEPGSATATRAALEAIGLSLIDVEQPE